MATRTFQHMPITSRIPVTTICACETPLRKVKTSLTATIIVKRTCRSCGTRWQVKVEPVEMHDYDGFMHLATLVPLEDGSKR